MSRPLRAGHWEPAALNGWRSWSDTRGLNSLQIVGLINAALRYAPTGSPDVALLTNAFAYLTSPQNYYLDNTLNTRINAPCVRAAPNVGGHAERRTSHRNPPPRAARRM